MIGDEIDPGFGFDIIRLCALVTERSDPQQTGLAAPDHEAELAHLIDRLGARFGLRRVTRLVPQDTHIPEFAVMAVGAHMASGVRSFPRKRESSSWLWVPAFAGTSGMYEQDSLAPTRPIRLFATPGADRGDRRSA